MWIDPSCTQAPESNGERGIHFQIISNRQAMASSSTTSSEVMPSSVEALLSAAGMPYPGQSTSSESVMPSTFATVPTSSSSIRTTGNGDEASQTAIASESNHKGLNTGAAVGIGIGATLGVVALILVGLWMLWRKRRRSNTAKGASEKREAGTSSGEDDSDVEVEYARPMKDGDEKYEAEDTSPGGRVVETDGSGRLELEGRWSVAELDGGWRAAEMDGSEKKG